MIADASLLLILSRAARLEVLRRMFGEILIPKAVYDEVFADSPSHPEVDAVREGIRLGWIRTEPVPGGKAARIIERFPNLGLGEAACLALAQHRNESRVLIDDSAARRAAALSGLRPIGCLGVVARAYRGGLHDGKREIGGVVRGLLAAGLWVGADVIEPFWDELGGRP